MKVDYKNNLISITNSILKHYNITPFHETSKELDNVLKNNYKHVVVILIDGMGINILNKHLDQNALLAKHYKKTLFSVFPPTTVAATNAFLSGKMPYETGFLGWTQYNELEDVTEVVFFEEDTHTTNKTKYSLLKQLNYKNFLTLVKEKNPNIHAEEIYIKPIKGSILETFEEELNRALMITLGSSSLTYLYYPLLDSMIHAYGTNSSKVKEHLNEVNKLYEKFIEEISDDTLVITTADHGFTNIELINLKEYKDFFDTLEKEPSIEGRAMTFFVKKRMKKEFKRLFNKYFKNDFKLISKKKVLKNKLFGYGLENYLFKTFLGDYLAVATTNKAFNLSDDSSMVAHHGGSLKKEMEVPLIINK